MVSLKKSEDNQNNMIKKSKKTGVDNMGNYYNNILRQLDAMNFMDRIIGFCPEAMKELKG